MTNLFKITTTIVGPAATGGGINELFFDGTAGTGANALDAAADFWEAIGTLALSTNTFTTLGDVEVVESTTGLITAVQGFANRVKVGQNSGEPVPKATMALLRLRTGEFTNGREIRGRVFIPGLNEAQSTDGALAAGTQTAITAAAQAMVDRADSALVVYSRTHRVYAPVTSVSTWSQWAMLRSRRD